jgi:hypothetical protein
MAENANTVNTRNQKYFIRLGELFSETPVQNNEQHENKKIHIRVHGWRSPFQLSFCCPFDPLSTSKG